MPKQIYIVRLDTATRHQLEQMLNSGRWLARQLKHARILLLTDTANGRKSPTNEQIGATVGCTRNTVQRIRRRFCQQGLEAALNDRPRPAGERLLDPTAEQKLVAIACSNPPNGADRWTLDLLVKEVVRRRLADSISDETIRHRLLASHPLALA